MSEPAPEPDRTDAVISAAGARLEADFGGPAQASAALLDWYGRHARDLPWRLPPGAAGRPDPYRVWLSEIMLQQTTVAAVKAYFARFVARWPAVGDLAAAPLDDVLHAWQGLGYYARARNLHRCARAVVQEHGGVFPDTEEGLRALPGIGAYTAAAIAAIAFGRPATVVDGNVERVMARLHAVETPLPAAKPVLRRLAALTTPDGRPDGRPGDYAQAVMDLGATVCTARAPQCLLCPWSAGCAAHRRGVAADLPRRTPKKAKPLRRGIVWWIERPDGRVMLQRRPENGLLGGMMEFPGTGWTEAEPQGAEPQGGPPVAVTAERDAGTVGHVFTHFRLELAVRTARTEDRKDESADGAVWEDPARLDRQALPTVMKKVARAALGRDNRRDNRGPAAAGRRERT
ncbi:MAG: A/G-specific adenine glycosylase [Rhodospirillaceae bacterium]|nr:A/G-specific adenine glycosylase [Rhodospirillaceae bacterium]